jgi:hypothetical protein
MRGIEALIGENDAAGDHVLQFADVAWPGIGA